MRAGHVGRPREPSAGGDRRAFRGLALVFTLSFVSLVGLIATVAALGGLGPWTRWQFVGLFGVVEAAAGLANVVSPNLWRLPIAELETGRTDVRLAASSVLLPHWGGLARCLAGLVCVALAASATGVATSSLLLVPLVLGLAWIVLGVSALVARAGVARPDVDVVQLLVRWRGRQRELRPLSLGASVVQFLLGVATIPAVKALPPSVLYAPELAPSGTLLAGTLALALVAAAAVAAAWSGRLALKAPAAQQREAEEHA